MCDKTNGSLPVIDMTATGQNIVRLRKAAGLSVRDLQEMFGFASPQAVYKWQNGEALPTIEHLALLSRILEVPIEKLIIWRAE